MAVDAKTVMKLREMTGAPMMDCKKALAEVGGDLDKAVEHLRKLGLKAAEKKASRSVGEGRIFSYIHHNGKIGVMVEILCETDFVARSDDFKEFGHQLCQHVAFHDPKWLTREEADPEMVEKEMAIYREQIPADKPEQVKEKILEGKMKAFFAQNCLLEQPFVHDDKITVEQKRQQMVGKLGENIKISRFVRFQLGS